VVALDVPTLAEAADLVDMLCGLVSWFKVGSELFTAVGPPAVDAVHRRGGWVFLDLKFHDIPRTVAAAVREGARLGVAMMTVHASAGEDALRLARQALRTPPGLRPARLSRASPGAPARIFAPPAPDPRPRPFLIAVSRLTSEMRSRGTLRHVVEAAQVARRCGLDGVVAAAAEVPAVRKACGPDFAVVTPGIRPAGRAGGDQARTATPAEAVRAGADFLVVGRPVLAASDPRQAVVRILEEMAAASRQERAPRPRKV
jgi:orotidine-5'-phosphate decarboxylase